MENKEEDYISLKALVDKEKNRVIFAECDHDFADVLFSFLTIPIGTIIRLARTKSLNVGMGCMNNLYRSVEDIDARYFRAEGYKAMLLRPHNGSECYCNNLRVKIDGTDTGTFSVCDSRDCIISKFKLLSYYKNVLCECGKPMSIEMSLTKAASQESCFTGQNEGVFVKVTMTYIVSDDLKVMLPCTASSLSLLSKCEVTDGSNIEERTFSLGVNEVLNLLICSLISRKPLTETLLKLTPVNELNHAFISLGRLAKSEIKKEVMSKDQSLHIKLNLFVSKSKKIVCYAEAEKDFINLIFSFLTIPLGLAAKRVHDDSFKGCIDNLYKSIKGLDGQGFKSNDLKEILVDPSVAPGFSYENDLLEIKEASPPSFYYFSGMYWTHYALCTDKNYKGDQKHEGPISLTVMHSKSHDKEGESRGGFLEGPNLFTVTDNLIIKPISPIFGLSILKELKVPFSDIEEQTVHVGKEEALRLLLSSFASEAALTDAFIRQQS